jgi:broad specificity phosphatase PhoE
VASPDTIVLIRHGEKPGQDGPPHGVNRHGEHDDHSLSVRGWTRAGALAAMFARAPHADHPAVARPIRVFATRPTHTDRSTRERDTALPTALRLGVAIDDSIAHGDEQALADLVLSDAGDTLVVWHHGELSDLARAFPLENAADVPERWPEDRFDLYWILARTPGSSGPYRFTVAPQLLLDGDAP